VILLVAPVLVGVLIGYAAGGRLANLVAVRLRGLWLLWLAAAVQAAQYYLLPLRRLVQDDLGIPMLAVVFATVLGWIALNVVGWPRAMRLAAGLIVLGAVGNGLAIAANGRMPYAPQAAVRAHLPANVAGPKNQPAGDATRLAWLGDGIPLPPLNKVLSAGDLLIAAGVSAAVAAAMRRRGGAAPANTMTGARRPRAFGGDDRGRSSPAL
jgi:Family of unknown function (DUF5317)